MTCKITKVKRIKTYEIDGVQYKSSTFVKYHKEFREAVDNNIIHSFTLPNNGVDKSESKYKNNNGAIIDDKHFDSIMEARFYLLLCKLKRIIRLKILIVKLSLNYKKDIITFLKLRRYNLLTI